MTDSLDPAEIMIDHRANEIEGMGDVLFCLECDIEWPCLPYRLAAEIERLRGLLTTNGRSHEPF